MASSYSQQSRESKAPFGSGFAATPAPAGLLALTQDAALVAALRALVDAEHRFTVVTTETALTDHLMASSTRAALIDSSACQQPVAQLTERLKSQFPDLVLVVAGTSADQGVLASQITDGRVFRFLHKPVSAQRVKLFVESAFRRSDSALPPLPTPQPTRASGGRSRAPLVAGGIALALVVGVAIWWATRTPDPVAESATRTTHTTATTAAVADSQRVLDNADAALARGALIAPSGESAADLYRQVLAGSPGNVRANTGLDTIVDRLLGNAEKAIVAEQLDAATGLVDSARALRPAHPRVAFLSAQIGKERERQLLSAAREAAASGNLDRAISVLESGSAAGSELLGAAKRQLQQQEIDSQAAGFLALADARMKSGALIEPAQDNARFYIESARALAPGHAGLRPAERSLQAALTSAARGSIAAGDLAAAERWIAAADENGAERSGVTTLRRELQGAQIERKAADLATLARQFNERLRQNRLIEPAGDSARALYTQMRDTDPKDPATLAARDALGKEMLDESRVALARADIPGAERWVSEAEALGLAGLEITNARRDIATLQARNEQATDVVPVSQLSRLRVVEPRYPADARASGQTGWVDLEFTVTPKGTVSDVRVTGASAAGVFDEAASEAIARWRFKPVERNGVAVPQRAKLRIRFDLQ